MNPSLSHAAAGNGDDFCTESGTTFFANRQAVTAASPFTAAEYARFNLPRFEYYDETARPLPGGEPLRGLKSVAEMGRKKGDAPLPENESVDADVVINLRGNRVREEEF